MGCTMEGYIYIYIIDIQHLCFNEALKLGGCKAGSL